MFVAPCSERYAAGGQLADERELRAATAERTAHRLDETLCWTPSRAKGISHFSDHYNDRIPDCTTCLRTAHRLDPGASDE